MARVIDSGADSHDFCKRHYPAEAQALEKFGNLGDGPDGRGNCFAWDPQGGWAPPYEGEGYRCETCGRRLTEEDD